MIIDWDDLEFFKSQQYINIVNFLGREVQRGNQTLPSKENILNAFVLTPLSEVKVVILGQDPYPTISHPNGLSFSAASCYRYFL